MIVIMSDTHRQGGPNLDGALESAIQSADRVLHAGDFTTRATYETLDALAGDLIAVHGNADQPALQQTLPGKQVVDIGPLTVAMTHAVRGGQTGRMMFGRAHNVDLVVTGHTHEPALATGEDPALLNPGSHADPRGNRPGYATIDIGGSEATIELRDMDGAIIEDSVISLTS